MDASALLRDALERNDDVLVMVEFEAELRIEERDTGSALDSALLGNTLVGVGDGATGVLLTWATWTELPDAYGYGGTLRSLGKGGTEGTSGRTTVGAAGTVGTCGKEGCGGTGTDCSAGSAGGSGGTVFNPLSTADTAAAATGSKALTTAEASGAMIGLACVFVSCATRFPLVSTVATT
jgi:hypothetical protein